MDSRGLVVDPIAYGFTYICIHLHHYCSVFFMQLLVYLKFLDFFQVSKFHILVLCCDRGPGHKLQRGITGLRLLPATPSILWNVYDQDLMTLKVLNSLFSPSLNSWWAATDQHLSQFGPWLCILLPSLSLQLTFVNSRVNFSLVNTLELKELFVFLLHP